MAGLTTRLLNEGMRKGELNMLLRQLTRRFGPLDDATETRLQQASAAELERWTDNTFDARTLKKCLPSTELFRQSGLRLYLFPITLESF